MTKIIAHRGSSTEAPENTLSSIRAAIASEVDYVEVDLRLTREGIPIVIHDPCLDRTGGIKGFPPVHRLNLEQIKAADAGGWFHLNYARERVPTLEEMLQEEWGSVGVMLEIKKSGQKAEKIVSAIFSVLARAKTLPVKISMGSFSLEIVQCIKNISVELSFPIELIGIVEKKRNIQPFIECRVNQLALWEKLVDPLLMQMLIQHKVEVWSFTVDDRALAAKLIEMGVDGIITNCPRNLLDFLRNSFVC